MKQTLLLYCLLGTFLSLHPQKFFNWWDPRDENIDSLKKSLAAAKGTARIQCLNSLCYAYSGYKRDSSAYFNAQACREAEQRQDFAGLAIALFYKAQLAPDYEKLLQYGYQSAAWAKRGSDERTMAFAFALLGWHLSAHGEFEKTLVLASTIDSIAAKSKDTLVLGQAYQIRSFAYLGQNKLYEALQLLNKLSPIVTKYLGDEGYANNLHNIARIYTMIGDHQTAVSYFRQSIRYREQHKQTADWGNYSEISTSYGELKKYDSALYYLDYGLREANRLISDSVARTNMVTEYLVNKGLIYFDKLENDDSAMFYFRRCFADYKAQHNDYMVADLQFKMGRLYFKQGHFQKAFRLAKEAMPAALKMASPVMLAEAYLLLADLYMHDHQPDSAYHYLRLHTNTKKPAPPSPANNNLTFYKTMLENEKNASQIQLLNKDNELKQQRMNLLVGTTIAILVLAAVSLYVLILRRKNEHHLRKLAEKELQRQKLESSKAKAELQVQTIETKMKEMQAMQQMRMQIAADLHDDIGSTLTSISYYSEMIKMKLSGNDDLVLQLLDKIGTNARSTVTAMSDIVWVTAPHNDSTSTLVERMKSFAAEMLGPRNITYCFHTDAPLEPLALSMAQRKNIYLIYKEAMHNAVKYSGCTAVSIYLRKIDDQLSLSVADNGCGFSLHQPNGGNGLPNMKKRAGEIKAALCVQSAMGQGTAIELRCKIT